jgi:hypothetical protein
LKDDLQGSEDNGVQSALSLSWLFQRLRKCMGNTPTSPPKDNSHGMEVTTRRSVEVRESFHEIDESRPYRGWDLRNPYPGEMPDEDGEELAALDCTILNKI